MVHSKEERLERVRALIRTFDTHHYNIIASRMMNVIAVEDPKHEYQCANDFCPHCMRTWSAFMPLLSFPFVLYNRKLDLMYCFILCPTCSAMKGVNHKNKLPDEMKATIEENIISLWDNGKGAGSVTLFYVDNPLIAPHSADEAIWEWMSNAQ